MKEVLICARTIVFVLFASTTFAQSSPDDIAGKWTNAAGSRTIEIYKENDLYYGKTLSDGKHAGGKIVLRDFKFQSANKWKGKLYVPKKQQKFPCTISLTDIDNMVIEGSYGFASKSKEWRRVK